jgi:hypothetical protein
MDIASNHRPIQNGIKLAQFSQRPVQDIEPRLSSKIEDAEQVILMGNVFGAADLVARYVERKELAQSRRFDL